MYYCIIYRAKAPHKKWVIEFVKERYQIYGFDESNVDPLIVTKTIEDLAEKFKVSKLSAKIRMMDLGL